MSFVLRTDQQIRFYSKQGSVVKFWVTWQNASLYVSIHSMEDLYLSRMRAYVHDHARSRGMRMDSNDFVDFIHMHYIYVSCEVVIM